MYLLEGIITNFSPEDETACPSFLMSDGVIGHAAGAGNLLESLAKTGEQCHVFGVVFPLERLLCYGGNSYRMSPLIIQSHESFLRRWETQPHNVHDEFKNYWNEYHAALLEMGCGRRWLLG